MYDVDSRANPKGYLSGFMLVLPARESTPSDKTTINKQRDEN